MSASPALTGEARADIEDAVASYYTHKVEAHGMTAAGVDWRDEESQLRRFAQLARLMAEDPAGSVIDLGCGYGAFARFLRSRGHSGSYLGLDLSAAMIAAARQFTHDLGDVGFRQVGQNPKSADYVVASGIFNVRGAADIPIWEAYVAATLADIDRLARRGWAYNCLSLYSDAERRRADLFYADPLAAFARAKNDHPNVALLHDYGLYEFTLIVRK